MTIVAFTAVFTAAFFLGVVSTIALTLYLEHKAEVERILAATAVKPAKQTILDYTNV